MYFYAVWILARSCKKDLNLNGTNNSLVKIDSKNRYSYSYECKKCTDLLKYCQTEQNAS